MRGLRRESGSAKEIVANDAMDPYCQASLSPENASYFQSLIPRVRIAKRVKHIIPVSVQHKQRRTDGAASRKTAARWSG